jgi:hypothetical protein
VAFPAVMDEQSAKELQEYQQIEMETRRLAEQYRRDGEGGKSSTVELTALKEKLEQRVQAAFDLRMRIHDRQVELIKNRLAKVQWNLAKRTEARDRIIADRVSELLGEGSGLQWDGNPFGPTAPYGTVARPRTSRSSGVPMPPQQNIPPSSYAVDPYANSFATGRKTIAQPPGVPDAADPSAATTPNATSGERLSALEAASREVESQLEQLRALKRRYGEGHPAYVAVLESSRYRKNLEEELKLFEFDIREAELLLSAAEAKLAGMHEINRRSPHAVTKPQVEVEEYQVQLAKIRLERLMAMRERYRKLLDADVSAEGSTPEKAKPRR